MKTVVTFIFVILAIAFVDAIPSKTWCQTTRCSTGHPMSVAAYYDSGAGNVSAIAVSDDGSYCQSTDFGQSWTYSPYFPGQKDLPLWWAQYSRTGQVLISGDSCRLFLSTNNGSTFSMRSMPCLTRAYASAFSPSGNIIAVTDNNGWLYTSSDGGYNWVGPTLVPGVRLGVYSMSSLSMPDDNTIVMVGGISQAYVQSGSSSTTTRFYFPFLIVSTDGGATTRSVSIPSALDDNYSWTLVDVSCKGGRCLFVGSRGLVGRYQPGVPPSFVYTFPYYQFTLQAVYCTDSSTCYVGGSFNLLALTTDYGTTWTMLTNTQPYSIGNIVGIFCANEEYCFAASDSGLVLTNSGFCAAGPVVRPAGSGASLATLASSAAMAVAAVTLYFVVL